jgi:alpha-tubulin suppressor-like RCC1 family protein
VLALNLGGCPATSVTHGVLAGTTTSSGATTSFTVNPQGSPTSYYVKYGLTTGYGKTTAVTLLPGENGEQSATAALSGLETCTTYHYQVEANNKANEEAGTPGLGGDQSFTTSCVTGVSVDWEHVCATISTGGIKCWGYNELGVLGNGMVTEGSEETSTAPGLVSSITNATSVSAGMNHNSCALLATGHVDCWGANFRGEDGVSGIEDSLTPVAVTGITNATAVSTGDNHSCALLSTGRIECWGGNEYGVLGDGSETGPETCGPEAIPCSMTPVGVTGITNAIAVAAGYNHTCAVLSTGHVECWGWDIHGELGNGKTQTSPIPVEVTGITNATSVTTGNDSCALLTTGHVKCWGSNGLGDLGDGNETESRTPVEASGISTATAISGAGNGACALLSTGHVSCWGWNESGQLGNGTNTGPETCGSLICSTLPVPVSYVTTATSIGAGYYNTCAVLSNGTLDCWGANRYGAIGYPPKEEFETQDLPVRVSEVP